MSIDHLKGGAPEIYRKLAELQERSRSWRYLNAAIRHKSMAEGDAGQPKNNGIGDSGKPGKINVMHSYHSLGRVLRDAGFVFRR